jgi:hypothetical protein
MSYYRPIYPYHLRTNLMKNETVPLKCNVILVLRSGIGGFASHCARKQCCGAETICSGSDFQKVSALARNVSFVTTCLHSF